METKKCRRCKIEKDLDSFYNNPKLTSGKHSNCKQCMDEKHEEYRSKNPKVARDASRRHYYKSRGLEEPPRKTNADRVFSLANRALKRQGLCIELVESEPHIDGENGIMTIQWRVTDDM